MVIKKCRLDDWETAKRLYADYMIEMSFMNPALKRLIAKTGEPVSKMALEEIEFFYREENTGIYFIRHGGMLVGFVVLGTFPNASIDGALYIQEFYVLPQFRRKGFGRAAVRIICESCKDQKVEFFVLKENPVAKRFWMKAMKCMGYTDVSDREANARQMEMCGEYCTWFCYEPAENVDR